MSRRVLVASLSIVLLVVSAAVLRVDRVGGHARGESGRAGS
jgi:hypothetical protein